MNHCFSKGGETSEDSFSGTAATEGFPNPFCRAMPATRRGRLEEKIFEQEALF